MAAGLGIGWGINWGSITLAANAVLDYLTFKLNFNTIATDFTFTRNSFATRVNEFGLIETVTDLGSELVVNGDFEDGTTDWQNPIYGGNNSATLSIDNGALKVEKNANLDWRSSFVNQTPLTFTSGKTYKITYSLKDGNTSGADVYVRTNFDRSASTVDIKTLTNDWVDYTDYYVADSSADDISFGVLAWQNAGSGQYYFIDNVSVQEILEDDVPRIDYSTGEAAFLLEPISTNLINYSEDFSGWINTFSTDTFGAISPSGLANATTLTDDGNGGASANVRIQKNGISINATTVYTFSCFLKPNPNNIVEIKTANDDAIRGGAFDLSTKTFTPLNSETGNIESLSNNWYKVSVTWTSGSDTSIALRVGFPNIIRDGTNSFILWGAQLEELSYATSYIPTNGSIVTRAQESCVDATPTINSEEGVLYAEISALSDDLEFRNICINDASTDNRVVIRYKNASNVINFFLRSNNSTVINTDVSVSNIKDVNKVAFKYKSGDIKGYINGTQVLSDTDTFTFSFPLQELDFNDGGNGGNFYGNTKDLKIYDKALTDEELTELTTI